MSLLQYRIFYASCLVVSLLFIGQVVFGRIVQTQGRQLSLLEQGIQRGQQSYARWQQLAGRTYQVSQTDAGLKDVIVRQQITVKPSGSTAAPANSTSIAPGLSSSSPKNPTANE